jgi:hypothetical protein
MPQSSGDISLTKSSGFVLMARFERRIESVGVKYLPEAAVMAAQISAPDK